MNKKVFKFSNKKDKRYYLIILLSSMAIPLATALLIVYGNSNRYIVDIFSIIVIALSFISIIYSSKKLGIKISSLISSIIKAIPLETLR